MPQLILEFSANILEKENIELLFQDLHSILSKTLPTDLDSCKSRLYFTDTYCVGNGQSNNAFIHITLKVMPGRSPDTLKTLGDSMMELLKNYFSESLKKLNLQVTLEIIELQKTYFKITS